jgi:hypothetical protein
VGCILHIILNELLVVFFSSEMAAGFVLKNLPVHYIGIASILAHSECVSVLSSALIMPLLDYYLVVED